jgi:NTE family protein
MSRWWLPVVAVLLVLPVRARAADGRALEGAPPRRPTIGVALEGGGAFGLAHVGVLEWFEAHHIPVDYVAGTSMGALIGGLYAVGKSPAELRTLTREMDWDLVLGGSTPYRNLTFRRREDLRAYPNSFLLGLRHGVRLPPGLNAGQQITLLMDRETMAYSEVETFDELPIPFRCVATELVSGQPHVFADGPLAEALRATMSIPGFFTPIRVGEHVYADGGIVNNLPTDVVRQMGADVVVAVHLDERKRGAADIQTMFQVVGRTIDLGIIANEARGLAGADITVSVDVAKLSAMDYARGDLFMDKGREAAEEAASALQPHALGDEAWAEYLESRRARKRHITPRPQFLRVEGTDARAARHLEAFLAPFVGKEIDGPRLDRDLTRLSGIGKYSRVGYRIVREGGREGLLVTVEENDYAPPFLQPGFELDGSDVGSVGFTLGARLTVMDVGGYRSEWRTDASLGSVYGLRSEYYRPLTASSKWFVAPEVGAMSSTLRVDGKTDPVAEYRVGYAGAGVDLGYGFSRFVQARLGYEIGYLDADLRLGSPVLGDVRGQESGPRLRVVYDQTDDPVIPRRGAAVDAALRWYVRSPGAPDGFRAGSIRVSRFQPITRPSSVFLVAEGGTTFGEMDTGRDQFSVGGAKGLLAYGTNELHGNEYVLLSGGYLRDLWRLPTFVGKKVYVVAQVETAKVGGESGWASDVAVGLVAQTMFGPLFVGGSAGNEGHRRWFFKLGRVF